MNEASVQIVAEQLHKSYELERVRIPVLRGVSLTIRRGERLAITGASGAGKSTLLHVLGGLDRPNQGHVFFEGRDLYALPPSELAAFRSDQVGFVFQAYHLLPELDLLENVMVAALHKRGALRRLSELRERACTLLDRVGLGSRLRHRPVEVSGGEQQRAAIARALMNDPAVLFADEPTGNLDSTTGRRVLDDLFGLADGRRLTLVLVTHNEEIARLCERQLVLRDGQLQAV
ncbi:MAG: ABC transporter ATP-binding protein [Kiritimatiellae bacterium]|nr:ABC transporter ATP-binding protein [Kiritimatiellia bacterium]MDW8458244.1 ABC transporter ATP-binding protein [Verrucomicrobiota bacterium]